VSAELEFLRAQVAELQALTIDQQVEIGKLRAALRETVRVLEQLLADNGE
jgi:hypothetical protein